MAVKALKNIGIIGFLWVFGCHFYAYGQIPAMRNLPLPDSARQELPPTAGDTTAIPGDTTALPNDTTRTDSLAAQPVGDIKTTVKYHATDSITLNMRTSDVTLFGNAQIDYKPITLKAQEIMVNWDESMMMAQGKVDSTGKKIGTPVFVNGKETYETNEIKYNFKTEKALITGLVTQQGDGYIHADRVFKNAQGELFNETTYYTTCNLAHPHFSIKARKVKVIPGKEMVSGPFNMVLHDVPLPIGFVFGIFPDQQHRSSGIIVPTFGEETRRGFYLRNGGYYFAINDYIDLELTGDIYTQGGWGVRAASTYKKRYKYSGNLLFNFTKLKLEDENTLEISESNDFRLSWSHNPMSRGTGRFSANVNIASATYNLNNKLFNQQDQMRANLSSSVNYSKSFKGTPFSIGISGRFNQNLNTKQADILLPEFNLNVQNIYPFKRKGSSGQTWYQRLVFRYTMQATNKVTNKLPTADGYEIVELNPETLPELIKKGSNGFKHEIPVSTTLSLLKYFKINPNFNYKEVWYFKKLDYRYDEDQKEVVIDTLKGFNAWRTYSAGVGINTILYGMAVFKREYGVQAIRHQMIPSISYTYQPDFTDPRFDYFQEVQKDSLGNTQLYSRYAGFVYGQPGRGESSSIGISISNTLEMKYRSRSDTTGKAQKIALLRSFNISTAYNLEADSFRLAPISLNATTDLLKNKNIGKSTTITGLSLNFRGTLDPYVYILDSITVVNEKEKVYQRRIDQFAFNHGQGLGRFSTFNINISTGFRAKRRGGGTSSGGLGGNNMVGGRTNDENLTDKEKYELEEFMNNPDLYVDFNIPWSLRLTYTLNYNRVGFAEGKVTQSLKFNGDMNLTPKWKVTFRSGYDFAKKAFNETRLGIVRDLHCWDMRLDWVPFGRYQSYNFTIAAKSSLLQDLKLSKRRNATDSFTFR